MEINGVEITKLSCPKSLVDSVLETCYETSPDIFGFSLFEDEGYWCWYGWHDYSVGLVEDEYYPVDITFIRISNEATKVNESFKEKLNKLLDCANELLVAVGGGILDMILFVENSSDIRGDKGEVGYIDNYNGEEIVGLDSKGCRNIAVVLI